MGSWEGKVVVVTGASSGIGMATARSFSNRGAAVVLAARRLPPMEELAREIEARGGKALAVQCDVTINDDRNRLIEQAVAKFGRLDVLVNNAGRSMRRCIEDTTADDFRGMMELNFFALVDLTQRALPELLKNQGHVVNISSLAGRSATRYQGAYPASKHAVCAYSAQLRLELGPRGLHSLVVCPGPVDTPLMKGKMTAKDIESVPAHVHKPGAGAKTRTLRPEEVADAIVNGCESRRGELIWPWYAKFMFSIQQLSTNLSDAIVRAMT